jgi:hypothetical protein
MAGFSQDASGSETQQWSQNSPWMSWNQPQFGVHGPSLGSRNFNNFQLYNDEDVEVIGTQMQQYVEDSREMSMREEAENVSRKEADIGKKKRGRPVGAKSKAAPKKKAKVVEVDLGDSEGEEEAPIKWRDYEIETLIAIRGEMEEEFAKSARKQGMYLCIYVH